MSNIYYNPEDFSLTIVGEIDKSGGYDFDKFVVFQKQDKSLWYATDSGCSCPSPFDTTKLPDLKPLPSRKDLLRALDEWGGYTRAREDSKLKEKMEFEEKVSKLLPR